MKLSYKIIIITILSACISIGLLSYFTFTFTKSSISQSIESQQLQLAQQTMDKIDRLLYEQYNNIQTIAGDRTIQNFLKETNQTNSSQNPTQIIPLELTSRVEELATVTGPWDDIDIVSADGIIKYSINTDAIGKDIQKEPQDSVYFTKAVSGNVLYGDVTQDSETKKPTMFFASPIRDTSDPSRKILGVVVTHLSWPVVSEILGSIRGSVVDLYNSDGVEVNNNDDPSVIFKENNPNVKTILAGKKLSLVAKDETGTETVNSSVTEKGFLDYKGNNWVLLIKQPTSIAFAPAVDAATSITVILIPVLIFSSILLLIFILQFLKPIELLIQTTKQIAEGDLNKRAPISSRDEIGQLAMAFNNMAEKLQELYQGLEEKVKEKTAELSQRMQELGEEKAKDDILLQSIGDGMIATDSQARIVKINDTAKQILDIETDVVSKEIFDAFQVYGVEGVAVPRERRPEYVVLESAKVVIETFTLNRRDGNKHVISIVANPVIQSGKLIGAIMIVRDVTKEKEVDRMKTEFISLASYQLRTPLSAIKWFTEMLLAGDAGQLSVEQQDFAKNISESTERMIDLVNALLNISRIESGRIMIDPKPTDLKIMVEGIVKELQQKITKKEQQLIISVHEQLPQISIDPRLIGQVYMNLLTNAIKYTPKKGEISVFISRKGDDIISQVSDNGYGIPRAQQDKVFQKFFRAENVSKIETDGTGLGLYLIKAIVESSKGKIWFSSEEGKGTSFWFSLPVAGTPAKKGEVTLDV